MKLRQQDILKMFSFLSETLSWKEQLNQPWLDFTVKSSVNQKQKGKFTFSSWGRWTSGALFPSCITRALRELLVSEAAALRLTLEVILQPCDVMRKQPEALAAKPTQCRRRGPGLRVNSLCTSFTHYHGDTVTAQNNTINNFFKAHWSDY